jgi:predicted nucleic acid-binding Zn ribbon protein
MVDEGEQLRNVVKWRAAHRANNAVSLGDVLSELMENRVWPQQIRFELIAEAWSQLLPAELYQRCRIVDISGGVLKVLVDSPSYMYELQLLSCELLKELLRRCPRAQVREIKFAVG